MPSELKSEADKFCDLARELKHDEDEEAFEATPRRIAKMPPRRREKPPSANQPDD